MSARDLSPEGISEQRPLVWQLRRAAVGLAAAACLGPALFAQAGDLDPSFGVAGIRVVPFGSEFERGYARGMALQADGRILLAGRVDLSDNSLNDFDFGIARLAADGSDDASFGTGGRVLVPFDFGGTVNWDEANGVAVQADGRIVVAGAVENDEADWDFGVTRLLTDGALDTSFNPPTGQLAIPFDLGGDTVDFGRGVALQADGKIVVAGYAANGAGGQNYDFAVARLDSDGALDSSFGSGSGKSVVPFDLGAPSNDRAFSVALQPDGKILLAGGVDVGGGDRDFGIARLWPDGSVDTSFGAPSYAGKIPVSFNLVSSGQDEARCVIVQPDGRILAAGSAESTESAADRDFAVARLLASGELDPAFGNGGKVVVPLGPASEWAEGVAIQSDGKILLAGGAAVGSGASPEDFAVVRLHGDGSLDTSFGNAGVVVLPIDLGGDTTDWASSLVMQPDGKILVGGWATWPPSAYFAVARLLNDLVVFADGFESGDTSAWSGAVP